MDLSGLKWPLIIVVVIGLGWLLSSGGVNWMANSAMKATPGEDAAKDLKDEAMLSRLAGYQMKLWRYDTAIGFLKASNQRYGPNAPNYLYNVYRLAKCFDRKEMWRKSYNHLQILIRANANQIDDRVANNDNLSLRASKLKEMYGQNWK